MSGYGSLGGRIGPPYVIAGYEVEGPPAPAAGNPGKHWGVFVQRKAGSASWYRFAPRIGAEGFHVTWHRTKSAARGA